ncbi:insulinase family protein [Granulosicoccaceae sp. 1_MG-2023]|nr:insulinase family protein [Granulosicoccaceae sp. 1_MG-2023]
MTHPAFQLLSSRRIDSLNLTLEDYRHTATGARHFHFAADDDNNAFMVAFRTIPQDSTGVAHILEHTSLCGSRDFPVRDPFFMMTRRSLSTFMNAFTASDWTAYPFATQSPKDFDNLLRVYLDATFFPNLDELDFLQEGHRVEFSEPDKPDSPLEFKGVVYNEMKGAMSSPVQRIWQDLQSALFINNTYHYNSGGEPAAIPDLTHAQLKAFHARHYHPSNALFMTYGNLDVSAHQATIDDKALSRFSAQPGDFTIAPATRFTAPKNVTTRFATDQDNDEPQAQVVLSWLLGETSDPDATLDAQMLASALLDNSASPLRKALETTDLGSAPSDLCGFEDGMTEGVFVCGLEGCRAEDADKIEALILSVIEDVAQNGVPQSQLEAILHQIELSQREVGGGHFPYGLQLMVKSLPPALQQVDPIKVLDLDPVLERLNKSIRDPDYIRTLARTWLLDNPHRVRMTALPDSKLADEESAAERRRLDAMAAELSEADRRAIVAMTEKLRLRQESEDDPELLPSVSVSDAPKELKIPEAQTHELNGAPLSYYPLGSNGLLYQQVVVTLPALDQSLIDDLPLFCDCLNEVGTGKTDYLQGQERQAAVSGGISARLSVRSPASDLLALNGYLVLAGKALHRNAEAFFSLIYDTFNDARFDETNRLRELIAQIRAHRESGITQAGHRLAMQAAAAGTSAYAALSHRWNGLAGTRRLISLDTALKDEQALQQLADNFRRIREAILAAPRQFLLVGEAEHFAAHRDALAAQWPDNRPAGSATLFQAPAPAQRIQAGWTSSTQVNYCAKAYMTVPQTHEDAAALTVLGHFLRNGYLHRTIREQGGAYGGGSTFATDSGTFRFYSYRDPRFAGTLDDFDRSLAWLQENRHDARSVEEAILGVISDIDRPDAPAAEAIGAWYAALHGRTPALRREFRERVMDVSLSDLQRVADSWLKPETAHTAVITDAQRLAEFNEQNPARALTPEPLKKADA